MTVYDEIEIEDMKYVAEHRERGPHYTYPCPRAPVVTNSSSHKMI